MDPLVLLVTVLSNVDVRLISKAYAAIAAMTTFMVLPVNLASVMHSDLSTLAVVRMEDVHVTLDT